SRYAAMRAIADAHDDLLADVAALRVADGGVETGFERDRLLAHVGEERRHTSLHAQYSGRFGIEGEKPVLQDASLATLRGTDWQIHVRAGKPAGDRVRPDGRSFGLCHDHRILCFVAR